MLIACKCDVPPNKRRLDPLEIEQSCMEETGIEAIETSINTPNSHKKCISVMMRDLLAVRNGQSESLLISTRSKMSFTCI